MILQAVSVLSEGRESKRSASIFCILLVVRIIHSRKGQYNVVDYDQLSYMIMMKDFIHIPFPMISEF